MVYTAICLRARGNMGKSQTLRKVVEGLKDQGFTIAADSVIEGQNDIRIILKLNGSKVGIETQGDPNSRLDSSLQYFVAEKCKVIVCATRTHGMTVTAFEGLHPAYGLLCFCQTARPELNQQMAHRIIEEVNGAL